VDGRGYDRRPQVERPPMLADQAAADRARNSPGAGPARDRLRPRYGCLKLRTAAQVRQDATRVADTQEPEWTCTTSTSPTGPRPRYVKRPVPGAARTRLDGPGATPSARGGRRDRLQEKNATPEDRPVRAAGETPGGTGRFIGGATAAGPALALRVATRAHRPALTMEACEWRIAGRVGPVRVRCCGSAEGELADCGRAAWGRQPRTSELDFGPTVLAGDGGAPALWCARSRDEGDRSRRAASGQPLQESSLMHEEVIDALPEGRRLVRRNGAWMLGRTAR